MNSKQRYTLLLLVLIIISGSIYLLESRKALAPGTKVDIVEVMPPSTGMDLSEKERRFDLAKEITTPDGFINVDAITVDEFIGEKIVLIDFWTYSCINCQRTTPYLNAWWDKYKDHGLVIIGVHTPEFEFEKDFTNVQSAVEEFGIEYPVVLDNDYSTWRAYQNRYWPRKYLIDIDGFIVYDHIGEGSYEETESRIQDLLRERKERLGIGGEVPGGLVEPDKQEESRARSPEVYFGAARNNLLVNGSPYQTGQQILIFPDQIQKHKLYLDGTWRLESEHALNESSDARIRFRYEAANVFFVASSDEPVEVEVYRDGQPLGVARGADVRFENGVDSVIIKEDRLYKLVEDEMGAGEHLLELVIKDPGLKAFTFTFG